MTLGNSEGKKRSDDAPVFCFSLTPVNWKH